MKKWTVLGYGIKTAMCVQEKSAAENARILYPPSTLVIVSPHRSMASAWPLLRPGPGSNVSKLGGACVSEKEIPFPCRSIWGDGFSCTELQARTVFCTERGKERKEGIGNGHHHGYRPPSFAKGCMELTSSSRGKVLQRNICIYIERFFFP